MRAAPVAPTPVPAKTRAGRCPHVPLSLCPYVPMPLQPLILQPHPAPLPIPAAGQRATFALMQWLCLLLLSELKSQVPC